MCIGQFENRQRLAPNGSARMLSVQQSFTLVLDQCKSWVWSCQSTVLCLQVWWGNWTECLILPMRTQSHAGPVCPWLQMETFLASGNQGKGVEVSPCKLRGTPKQRSTIGPINRMGETNNQNKTKTQVTAFSSVDRLSGFWKIDVWKYKKRCRERGYFVLGSLCRLRHEQGRSAWQKCLLRHEPTLFYSSLAESEPT